MNKSQTIIASTPDGILHFRMCAIRRGLELEIQTPLRHSQNAVFKAAKLMTGEKTRKKCLAKLKQMLGEDA